jgi:hypothetical protein
MFMHAGFKPFWPVIFFLPWFIFGIACFLAVVVHRRRRAAPIVRVDGVLSEADGRRDHHLNCNRGSSVQPAGQFESRRT